MAPNNTNNGLYMPQTYSFLSPETFETLVEGYINQLHIRKRNKALITQQLANDCLMVLTNPENTAIFNPKFRWWVRKHFVFTVVGELRILLDKKNGKPVCVREQLYDKVCYFHHIIGHGGRDKTFAAITKSYSKVPAELVSLFTKNCQTCLGVRKYSKNKRPILNENEYPQHHSQQQQQQSSQPQQLTCDTTGFSASSSAASSATPQYHSQQQYQSMMSKSDQGTMTPISPMMHSSNSGFFGSSIGQSQHQQQQQQLDSTSYSQLQHHHMQQMQAMNAHHMSMTLGLSEMTLGNSHVSSLVGGLSGLGQINTSGHHMSALSSSSCSTPTTTMANMDLPSIHSYDMANSLLPLGHYQTALGSNGTNGLGSPSDLSHHHHQQYDHHEQLDVMGASLSSSAAQYSPLLEHYPTQQQQQQYQQFQNNDYTTPSYATTEQQLQSTYSAAMSLTSMPLMQQQQHNQHSYEQQQHHHHYQQQEYQQQESSPLLTQNQMFQKQIQQEQQRFHQQQHQHHQQQQQLSVSTSFSTLSGTGSSTSLSSPPPSAVPSLSCSITTPTTAMSSAPLLASVAHANAFTNSHLHPALSGLLDHEQKNHLSAVAELVSGVHDL